MNILPGRRVFIAGILIATFVATLLVALYWAWLDRKVADTFETSRWSLPAKVYARPLELYVGQELSSERLLAELVQLGYLQTDLIQKHGQYSVGGDSIEIFTRGFSYWDVPEPPRAVSVKIINNRVALISGDKGDQSIPLMRLDPVLIGKLHPRRFEDRELLSFDSLPKDFIDILIAVEDQKFFLHNGIDFSAIFRAAVNNFHAKRYMQGASTLTQQLVKNFYLSSERTLKRKFTEILMALSLEFRHSKEDILEVYSNEVFLGQDGNRAIHGFGLASLFYFGKPLDEISVPEIAMLVGMVKGPSIYDPRRHPRDSLKRRNVVIDVMTSSGLISALQAQDYKNQAIVLSQVQNLSKRKHPAFMNLVQRQLQRDYSYKDLNESGLRIFTTLDWHLQAHAEKVLPETIQAIEADRSKRDFQAAAVVVDPRNGEILVLVGDRNPRTDGFNRATDAIRPIGSVIKPFVYAYALGQPTKYSLISLLNDRKIEWTDPKGFIWSPKNYDGKEYGTVTILEALTKSLNLSAIALGFELGLEQIREYLISLGVERNFSAVPSLLLGSVEMSPLKLAELYTPLANDGFRVPLQSIKNVTTKSDKEIARYGLEMQKVMEVETANLVRYALMRVASIGTARSLQTSLPNAQPLAGKTGTSNDNRDSWFVGFGSDKLGVTWVGRDDNSSTGLTGGSGALPVWAAIMEGTVLKPVVDRYSRKINLSNIDLLSSSKIPAKCSNGELVPLHSDSWIREVDDCDSAVSEGVFSPVSSSRQKVTRSILDRFKNFFD